MCRLVGFLGNQPILLKTILSDPENSLISQSKSAKIGETGVNADGFGIGWYQTALDPTPAVFNSIQPAWNDDNLGHICSKTTSNCFIGHVRASTVGDVNPLNCHPFSYEQFLFAHNGTIREFDCIRRPLLEQLSDACFFSIKGHTDSEHFFALFIDCLAKKEETGSILSMFEAFKKAVTIISALQQKYSPGSFTRINSILSNGKSMLATRYTSDLAVLPLSLYYSTNFDSEQSIIIASEPLNNQDKIWHEVPPNHALLINENQEISIKSIG